MDFLTDGRINRMTRTKPILCFLVLFVLDVWTDGDTEVSCVVMETCTLPCSFQGHTDAVVHWIYTAENLHVYSYYNNHDQLANQAPRFRGRTSLFQDQITGGNASLQVTEVQVQDQGTYRCYTSTISGNIKLYVILKVVAPVSKIHIEQVGNRISCSSEGIYPEPGLTWSTNPPSNTTFNSTTTVQQTEQLLYNISSSLILSDEDPDVDVSCTISTSRNRRTATLRKLASISSSGSETFVPCTNSNASLMNFSLVWRFNQRQIILNRTKVHFTVFEEWRQHVKTVSGSGSLTLQQLTMKQQGTYSCELSDEEETYVTDTFVKVSTGHQISMSGIVTVVFGLIVLSVVVAGLPVYYRRLTTQQIYQHMEVVDQHRRTSAPSNLPEVSSDLHLTDPANSKLP